MIIRTKKKENPFAQIDKRILNDNRLSWGARGLIAYLLSKPNDWKVRLTDLVNKSNKDGEHKVKGFMKELRLLGYAEISKTRNEKGHLIGSDYIIHESPKNREGENHIVGLTERVKNRPSEKPTVGKTDRRKITPYTNNDSTNNDIINNKECERAHAQEISLEEKTSFTNLQKIIVDKVLKSKTMIDIWKVKYLNDLRGRKLEDVAEEYAQWYISNMEGSDLDIYSQLNKGGASKFQASFTKSWLANLHKHEVKLPSNVLPSRKTVGKVLPSRQKRAS